MNFLTAPMLIDHRIEQERRASRFRGRQELAKAFGNFIAGLADWDWFINPITFRDRCAPRADTVRSINQPDGITRCEPDPRLKEWSPSSWRILAGEPAPDAALAGILKYLGDLETSAGKPIGWVIGEEFGRVAGRYHCHLLITGVNGLRRDVWWQEAFQRFGRTRIEPFDGRRAAAYYTAKYAAKQLGGLHFGGELAGVNLAALEISKAHNPCGVIIVHSAALPRWHFHTTLPRRHR